MVDENEVVRLYKSGLTQSEVGERVGVSQSRVSQVLAKHDVETRFTKWWTDEEIEFLGRNYPPDSDAAKRELADELCTHGRSWKAVVLKASLLGFSRTTEEYRGSKANKRVLDRVTKRITVDLSEPDVGYVVGVLDSDGYTNNRNQIGLEVRDTAFLEKFERRLAELGFNPTTKPSPRSESKSILYACSKQFVQWYENEIDRFALTQEQQRLYLEALFEGDGTIRQSGYIMICSTDEDFKDFLSTFLDRFDFSTRIWQDGITLVPKQQRERFLELIDPVVKGPDYYDDDR